MRSDGVHPWRNTLLAGLANYIDAGSIVASAAALALWAERYQLSNTFVGLIGAFGANAIGAGVGALVGGRLCDRYGRKTIYQYDMLFYAFGMLWLVLAVNPWMIVVGSVLVGLAVGADIPASWSLIAETAPAGQRGRHGGASQILWCLGPLVVLLMFFFLAPWGITGARIVFAHLLVAALLLSLLRKRLRESAIWTAAAAEPATVRAKQPRFTAEHWKAMAFLVGMYGLWNLWAGTHGLFFPYLLRTIGDQSQAASVALQGAGFAIGMASIAFIFMPLADRVDRRRLFLVSAVIQIAGMLLLAIFPLTLPVAIAHVFLMSLGAGFGAQPFFQLWSAEMFPTLLRGTAQGLSFAIVRIALGFFSFFVPALASTGFTMLAWILTGFLVLSGLVGYLWSPRQQAGSLEQVK